MSILRKPLNFILLCLMILNTLAVDMVECLEVSVNKKWHKFKWWYRVELSKTFNLSLSTGCNKSKWFRVLKIYRFNQNLTDWPITLNITLIYFSPGTLQGKWNLTLQGRHFPNKYWRSANLIKCHLPNTKWVPPLKRNFRHCCKIVVWNRRRICQFYHSIYWDWSWRNIL